ncbi:hypothetical protein VP01_1365g2 [Puccinia sorghi]|uniref:Uncharacterized protein n=1 Tax=Puccinia sorghi TaxID=27349 RepID=A0A0L6VMB6_9BASI|nr:hypothetical protein VP01_1365g2 [Puccinia sorghi]
MDSDRDAVVSDAPERTRFLQLHPAIEEGIVDRLFSAFVHHRGSDTFHNSKVAEMQRFNDQLEMVSKRPIAQLWSYVIEGGPQMVARVARLKKTHPDGQSFSDVSR